METLKEQNEQINRIVFQNEDKIKRCRDAHKAALACLNHCLMDKEYHQGEEFITLVKECSEVTRLTSSFLLDESDFKSQICSICSEICIECAESCESIDPLDSIFIQCAKACRKCAESCLNFNAHPSHF